LPAARDVALPRQIAVELLEKRLDNTRLRKPLAIEPDGLGVGDAVFQPQTKEASWPKAGRAPDTRSGRR
jgi:hypothetical protein